MHPEFPEINFSECPPVRKPAETHVKAAETPSFATRELVKLAHSLPSTSCVQENREADWSARRRHSGAVCRLVEYQSGDKPSDDLLLSGGMGMPVVVSAVQAGGVASKCGVQRGDRLASVDGCKDFFQVPAEQTMNTLRGPTTLIFVGFVGHMRAEVHLHRSNSSCGLPARKNVIPPRMSNNFTLVEETVFHPGRASLFFMVDRKSQPSEHGGQKCMLELCRDEAHRLVKRALKTAQAPQAPTVGDVFDGHAEAFAQQRDHPGDEPQGYSAASSKLWPTRRRTGETHEEAMAVAAVISAKETAHAASAPLHSTVANPVLVTTRTGSGGRFGEARLPEVQ